MKEGFEIDIGDRELAINYVHRLHAYRRAIEEARGEGYSNLRSTTIRQRGTRIIFDNDSSAMDAIRSAAGMDLPTDEELDAYLATLEQGMDNDGESICDSDSGEQATPGNQEEAEVKSSQVNTDYLSLFQKTEDRTNKE